MAASRVVVHDIDQLEQFGAFLFAKRGDIAELYDSLTLECFAQERNWQDPQYDALKEKLEAFALISKTQLDVLKESAVYISHLVDKLRNV